MANEIEAAQFTVQLQDGRAELLGGGLFGIVQHDGTKPGKPRQVVILTREDLEAMLAFA